MNGSSQTHDVATATQPSRWGRGGVALVFVIGMLLLAGCGDGRPKRVPVSGQVLLDGQPLKHGNIRFVPEGARPSAGKLDEDGHFTLTCFDGEDGAVLGTHRVQVSASEIIGGNRVRWHAPRQYSDFRKSGIVVEITEPTDSLTIELTGNARGPEKGSP